MNNNMISTTVYLVSYNAMTIGTKIIQTFDAAYYDQADPEVLNKIVCSIRKGKDVVCFGDFETKQVRNKIFDHVSHVTGVKYRKVCIFDNAVKKMPGVREKMTQVYVR